MSGFAAIIRFDGQPADGAAIRRMTEVMRFRGSDGLFHHVNAGVALGHCALYTTPGAAEAPQPLFSADDLLAIVMDGWLANAEELQTALADRKARVRGLSDAELILHAYAEWGDDCASRLEGEYAIVIHDARRNRVFCLRDHLGMRPLHWHWDGRRLLIASDVAGVLAADDFERKFNTGRMAENLASECYVPDDTAWSGVHRLPLATAMVVEASGPRTWRYWTLPLDLSIRYKNEQDYFEHYREILMDSVRRASRSPVPIACEVSGGHDSSAIFALSRRLHESGRLLAPDSFGFTLAGVPGSVSDEIAFARDVGAFLGVPIHEAERSVGDIAWFERNVVADRDMPDFPNAQSMAAEAALVRAKGCKVLLDGEGGDEFAGGSGFFIHEMLREGQFATLAHELKFMRAEYGIGYVGKRVFRFGLRPFAPLWFDAALRELRRNRRPWGEHLGKGPHWVAEPVLAELAERREAARQRDDIWKIRNPSKRRLWRELCDPVYDGFRDTAARLIARFGLEMRTPMYSKRYFEFISALPETVLLRDGYGKYIHLQALQSDLPRSVLDRRSKAEFSFTFERQIESVRHVFEREIPAEAPEEVNLEGLARLWQHYLSTKEGIWELWRIYGWYRLRALKG